MQLIAAWNERQAKRMPMLFSPTIGAASSNGQALAYVYFDDEKGRRTAGQIAHA
jgi:hypothetical protein